MVSATKPVSRRVSWFRTLSCGVSCFYKTADSVDGMKICWTRYQRGMANKLFTFVRGLRRDEIL